MTGHALFSGGGSGGHVFPGLAIAAELQRRGWQVSWAGSARGIEARLVGQSDVPFHHLPARPLVGQGLGGKIGAVWTLARGSLSARALVRRLDAQVVVGTGGYASAAGVVGARLASRRVLLVEPNAEAGFANRYLSRLADEAAVAHRQTAAGLSCPAFTTGVPVRAEFFDVPELSPGPPWRLLLLGGSQGALQLNKLLPQALAHLQPPAGDVEVCHQAGARHVEVTRKAWAEAGLPADVDIVPFIDDVPEAMRRSHVILSRAGAITLSEICAAGRAAVLVPLAIAGGHQVGNARRLAAAGAAEMLAPDEVSAERLSAILERLLGPGDELAAMGRAARGLARPDAAAAIADRITGLVPVAGEQR